MVANAILKIAMEKPRISRIEMPSYFPELEGWAYFIGGAIAVLGIGWPALPEIMAQVFLGAAIAASIGIVICLLVKAIRRDQTL